MTVSTRDATAQAVLSELRAAVNQDHRRRRRRLAGQVVLAASVTAVALAAAVVWEGDARPSLVERALAAVGNGPIVHAVVQEPTGSVYVDLETGERTSQLLQRELWFDQGRKAEHSVTRVGGRVVDELLWTPENANSLQPPVYTCRWILAHPAQARKAGVSCDPEDAEKGAEPRLDPALAAFPAGYRSALEDGRARALGSGTVRGRQASWLELAGGEQVAVDEETGQPLRVRQQRAGGAPHEYDVLMLETLAAGEGIFTAFLRPGHFAVSGQARDAGEIQLADAPRSLRGALWAGPAVAGRELVGVELNVLVAGYGPDSGRVPTRSVGVELRYGQGGARGIRIQQSTSLHRAYGWYELLGPMRPGTVLLDGFGGVLERNGVYVRIWSFSNRDAVLEVARALRPIPR